MLGWDTLLWVVCGCLVDVALLPIQRSLGWFNSNNVPLNVTKDCQQEKEEKGEDDW